MKNLSALLIVAANLLAVNAMRAADIKVVANSSVTASSVSSKELKDIYLQSEMALGNGNPVQPVLLKAGAAHESFVKEFVGKTPIALDTYYRSLIFTGKGFMPKTLSNDAEVVSYVAKTKGAIGYVGASVPATGVKTLELK